MKKIATILAIMLLCVAATITGQQDPYHEINIPKLMPPSPNVASLALFEDYPVSHYTGVPDISVPIYEIKIGDFVMPISLSYHGSGIRVSQDASWVGLGWALNVGGSITRNVRCLDDFAKGGYGSIGLLTEGFYYVNHSGNNFYYYLIPIEGPMKLIKDPEPDIFCFTLPNASGKFIFDRSHNPVEVNYGYKKLNTGVYYPVKRVEYEYDKLFLFLVNAFYVNQNSRYLTTAHHGCWHNDSYPIFYNYRFDWVRKTSEKTITAKSDGQTVLNESNGIVQTHEYQYNSLTYEAYDSHGNPLSALKDGIERTVWVWSYNYQYPIAEIVGGDYTYSQIETAIKSTFSVSSIEALAAQTVPTYESRLKSGNLQAALPNAFVTTYTYKPLVGIQTVTDSKKVTVTYNYDDFGRLLSVVDKYGRTVEGFGYHYRN